MNAIDSRPFDHVVIIMFENEYRRDVLRNKYMRDLAKQGIDMAGYCGVMHPSNTNYVASVAGEICNVSVDPTYYTFMGPPGTPPAPLTQRTIADRIIEKGLDWRAYMETYYPTAFPPQLQPINEPNSTTVDPVATVHQTILDSPPYLNMHNPFMRFQSIMDNREQWQRIGTAYDFLRDCLDGTLPEYAWLTPNIWGDGHWLWGTFEEPPERAPVLIDQLAKWLKNFFSVLRFPGPDSRLPPRTLVVVTFDESDLNQNYTTQEAWESTYDGPNEVYAVLLGDMIPPRCIEGEGYNHYSLLKTIEKNFDLGDLGKNDAEANWLQFLWGRHFGWSAPAATPIATASAMAAAGFNDSLVAVYAQNGALRARTFRDGSWSDESSLPSVDGLSAIALATCGDQLVLVCQTPTALSMLTFDGSAWSQPQLIVSQASSSIALASFTDYGTGAAKLMLAYVVSGAIQSQVYASGSWSAPVPVGFQTNGDLQLAVLGASLFLIRKAVGTNQMNVVSYNTAAFNVVTNNGSSNSTQYAWSPSEFPVAFFAFGPSRSTPGEPEPLLHPYEGAGPYAAATLDGVIHLAHAKAGAAQVVTETFSLSGILTPANAVAYNSTVSGTSNGYGTLAEAGWARQAPIGGATNAGAMSMARFGSRLALLFQPQGSGAVQLVVGEYSG